MPGRGITRKDERYLAYSNKMITSSRWALRFTLAAVAAAVCWFASPTLAQQTPDQPGQQSPGSVTGTIVDKDGNVISGAQVTLTRDDQSPKQIVQSGDDGRFTFTSVAPGPFHLAITATAYATQTFSGTMVSGQSFVVPPITVTLATVMTVVRVEPTAVVAERQIKAEEQQRVLKVVPNYYVTYDPNAAPLNSKQKSDLAWKTTIDPVTFALIGVFAGFQQAANSPNGYGQGAQGYGKRYGASYADYATGAIFGSVLFPAILKQDPRYFYKGTGTTRSRVAYAIFNAVICKGDNGHWQPNYSGILGNLSSGAIANSYYPAKNRGVPLTFEVAASGIGATAAYNMLEEFVLKKLTPAPRNHEARQSTTP